MAKKKRKKALKNLSKASPAEIAKFFAGEVLLLSGKAATTFDGDVVSTGLRSLNRALGIGGVPRGRIIELFGPESSGKTTLALKILAQFQKAGLKVAFIDAEHALNLKYARQIGLKTEDVLICQPDGGEEALELVHKFLKTKAVSAIVVDSVAALVPMREQEKGVEGTTMGMQAGMMSKGLRIMNPRVSKSNTLVIFINQTRMKIGLVFGNPETTSGGMALKFFASMRWNIRSKPYKKGAKLRGIDCRVKIIKNKLAVPFKTANLRLEYGEGWKSIKGDTDE